MDRAVGKEQVLDSVHEIKAKINHMEHEAIRARKILEQRLKGFEEVGA